MLLTALAQSTAADATGAKAFRIGQPDPVAVAIANLNGAR